MATKLGEHFELIVTDASPLITFAAADALHLLILPRIPIIIPDMVYQEVARDMARLGAAPIIKWTRDNSDLVTIAATEVYAEYEALLDIAPETRSRGRGEQAALEILNDAVLRDETLNAILLFEDSDINRRKFATVVPERVTTISTGAFLQELEKAGKIQSADRILDQAMAKGRNVDGQRQFGAGVASPGLRGSLFSPKKPGP